MNTQQQPSPRTPPSVQGKPRFQRAERLQVEMQFLALDQMLPYDHPARAIWQFVDALELSAFYDLIQAREGHAGRDPIDPKILLTLWLLATTEGVGSARKLSDLCTRDVAYLWVCGGVGVNYHRPSDFRTAHVELLDQLLTDSVATLLHQRLVSLERVAQDGMRVRASASSSSFRRRKTLEKCRQEACEQIAALHEEQGADPAGADRRSTAARQRAARERADRIDQALSELAQLEEKKERREKGSSEKARTSTTDPEARPMKMACGGFRPAYNVEFATTGESRVIVGVDVVHSGSDGGQMSPMVDQVVNRYGVRPRQYLADGGFSTIDDIQSLEQAGTEVYAPVKDPQKKRSVGVDPFARRKRDSDEVAAWRQRMGTDEAQAIYRERASTAEFPNAVCRNRGLQQFLVRGLKKVKAVALWHALAFNLTRTTALRAVAAAPT